MLADNQLGSEGAAFITAAVGQNSCITSINLRGNLIGDRGCAALAEALASNHEMKVLDVGDNSISKRGARSLAAAVSAVCPKLHSLTIEGNSRIGYKGVGALVRALRSRDEHENSGAGGNNTRDSLLDAGGISFGRGSRSAALSLDFGATNCGALGVAALADELLRPGGRGVGYLNLEECGIGAAGWHALSAALRGGGGVHLETLILYGNTVVADTEPAGAAGARGGGGAAVAARGAGAGLNRGVDWGAFAAAVGLCPRLTNLDLGAVGLSTAGTVVLAAVVGTRTCRLASLSLEGNAEVGLDGHVALHQAVCGNPKLVALQIDGPAVGEADGSATSAAVLAAQAGKLAASLERNRERQVLHAAMSAGPKPANDEPGPMPVPARGTAVTLPLAVFSLIIWP